MVLELHLRLLAYELRDLAHALPLTQPRLGLGLEQQRLDLGLHHVVVLALEQLLQLARVKELGQVHLHLTLGHQQLLLLLAH